MNSKRSTKSEISNYFYAFSIVVVIALLVMRCRYSFSYVLSDEFSQPATINRYLHGDRPFIEEWTASTMLSGFVMSLFYRLFSVAKISVLGLRYAYIFFQAVITLLIYALSKDKGMATKLGSLAYLCSTPYGINGITYNTISIGFMLLFCVLFFESDGKIKMVVAGVTFAIAVMAIPHNVLIFVVYVLIVVASVFIKKAGAGSIFGAGGFAFLVLGIAIVAFPFCVYLICNGTITGYFTGLRYILSDAEYSKSIFDKLIESQYKIIRVYWRAWLPLTIIDVALVIVRRKWKDAWKYAYIVSILLIVYATIRFAFIYGSVSINLMVVPIFFIGAQAIVMGELSGRFDWNREKRYVLWLAVGYLFYICEYLATDTEILSSSASLIVSVIPSLALLLGLVDSDNSNNSYKFMRILCYVLGFMYASCLLILRITFVWGDSSLTELNYKIDKGLAKGILTTKESADKYYYAMDVIEEADIVHSDELLILPMNPMYYYLADASCASPYVFRFEVSTEELDNYYVVNPGKLPTIIIAYKDDDSGNGYDIDSCIAYFENMTDMGYYVYYNSDDATILKR